MKIKTAAEITVLADATMYTGGIATFIPAGSVLTVRDAVYQRNETILHCTWKGDKFVCYVPLGAGPNEKLGRGPSTEFNLRTMTGGSVRAHVGKNGR